MTYRIFILIALSLLNFDCTHTQIKESGNDSQSSSLKSNSNMAKIIIDNVSFEENGMLKVYDENNNEIVRYNRFENKNIQGLNLKNTKIYNDKNELIITIVINIDQTSFQLHLLNIENNRGEVELISSAGFGSISTDVKVNYFNKKYTMKHITIMGIGAVSTNKELYLDGKLVIANLNEVSALRSSKGDIFVDKEYLANKREDVGIWAVMFFMMSELGK